MTGKGRFWTTENKVLVGVAVLIAILALLKSDMEPEEEPGGLRPSTFLSGESGALALYLACGELGISARQRMLPLPADEEVDAEGEELKALAILSPAERLLPAEAAWLKGWISRGGRLLYIPQEAEKDEVLKSLGLKSALSAESPIIERGTSIQRNEIERSAGDPLAAEAILLLEGSPQTIAGVPHLLAIDPPDGEDAEVLYGEGDRAAEILLRIGRGRAVVFSHPLSVLNGHLRESGAAPVALRALAYVSRGETVWFDEFHHGFDERGSVEHATWRFLTGTRPGWAVLGSSLVGLAALFCAGLRLGSPLQPAPPRRRSSLEHVEALATAYAATRAAARPATMLLEGLRLRLGVRSREDLKAKLNEIALAHPGARETVEEIARSLTARPKAKPADLVRLSRSIDRVLECVGESRTAARADLPAGGERRAPRRGAASMEESSAGRE